MNDTIAIAGVEVCRGKRDAGSALIGLCICCERRQERPNPMQAVVNITPPAARDDLGKWACGRLVKPAGW